MRKYILTTLLMIGSVLVLTKVEAQVGIGTNTPSNTLHVKPADSNEDPIRIEDLKKLSQGDSTLLVVDPATGVVRYLEIDSIFQYLSYEVDLESDNELQNASEVPMSPSIDIDADGTVEDNVQVAIEKLSQSLPKGTFRSIGDARAAGLVDGDSFWADPVGVFGCSGCVVTLHPGMN